MSLLGLQGYNSGSASGNSSGCEEDSDSESDSICSDGESTLKLDSLRNGGDSSQKKKSAVSTLFDSILPPVFLSRSDGPTEIERYEAPTEFRAGNDRHVPSEKKSAEQQPVHVPIHALKSSEQPTKGTTAVPNLKRKSETTRQKNNRKQKLGQATFTVKAERECPDVWQGSI